MKRIFVTLLVMFIVVSIFLWVKGRGMHTIQTEIEISAPPEKVWNVLMDFEGWKDWSPIMNDTKGSIQLGSRLEITMCDKEGRDAQKYSPAITILEAPRVLRWRAKMMAYFLFTNDKVIELEKTETGTRVIHKELFSGMLFPLMCGMMDEGVPPMLNSMNQALKKKVEEAP